MTIAEKLISSLKEVQPIIDSLLEVGSQHLEALKKNELELLNEVIQKQDLLARDLKELEQKIILEQQALAKELNLPEYKLAEVTAKLQQELAKELVKVQEATKAKLEKLKQTNELNNMIIKQNLAYTQRLMQVIQQLNNQANNQTYSQRGQVNKEESNSLINKQV